MIQSRGVEVIHLGHNRSVADVVEAAIQEDADVIALSVLSGAHMTIFTKVMDLLKKENINDILVTGGGIIPEDDMKQLESIGVGRLFAPGSSINESKIYIEEWVKENRS